MRLANANHTRPGGIEEFIAGNGEEIQYAEADVINGRAHSSTILKRKQGYAGRI